VQPAGGPPAVSVVIATRDRCSLLGAAARNVLTQTLHELELIIIDDGSSDATLELCRQLGEGDPRVRSRSRERAGTAAARNAGLAEARAPWVAFLDDDDLWVPEALEELLRFASDTRADAVACHGLRFCSSSPELTAVQVLADRVGLQVQSWPPDPPRGRILLGHLLLSEQAVVHAGLFSTALLQRVGGFDERCAAEDYELWLRLSAIAPIPVLPRPLALYRWHGAQKTSALGRHARETRQALERFLEEHPEGWGEAGRVPLRRRLSVLAREEAYASLRELEGPAARCAAGLGLNYWPFDLRIWLYWVFAYLPKWYAVLQRLKSSQS